MKRRHKILLGSSALLLAAFAALACYFHADENDWGHGLRWGPFSYRISVPRLIALASRPTFARALEGRRLHTEWGELQFRRGTNGELWLDCAPCYLRSRALSREPVRLERITLSLRHKGRLIFGELQAGRSVHATWEGQLNSRQLRLQIHLPQTDIARLYGLFGAAIPELARADIEGRFAADIELTLPQRHLQIRPQVSGFRVSGLGTQQLRGGASLARCQGQGGISADPGRWLPQAVVAAEDQRFYQHPGYDLEELTASLARNQQGDRIARGGSTLDQQLAKLLFTGSERTHIRKLRELLYAVEMQETLGKAQELRLYLAIAPWGQGLCGAEMAAQRYFGKSAAELDKGEAAWLAAMLHSPDREYRTWLARGQPDRARLDWVLKGMGQGPKRRAKILTRMERRAVQATPALTPEPEAPAPELPVLSGR